MILALAVTCVHHMLVGLPYMLVHIAASISPYVLA